MTSDELEKIIELAPQQLAKRIGELRPQILEAAKEALEATQESEGGGKPCATVGLKLKILLNALPVNFITSASVGITYKTEGEVTELDDPSQPGLFDENDYDAPRTSGRKGRKK